MFSARRESPRPLARRSRRGGRRVVSFMSTSLSPIKALALAGLTLGWPPTPAQSPPAVGACPEIVADGPADVGLRGNDITFRIKNIPPSPGKALTYNWTISAGTIVSGQGTAAIVTDLTGGRTLGTEVTVEIRGLPASCQNSISYSLPPIIGCGRPLDSYGNIRFNDEKARLDNIAIELQNDPTARGHIICYGGRKGVAGEAQRRCDRAKGYLSGHRHIEAARIVTVDGGYREDLTVEAWVIPSGAAPPQASPTVDPSEVQFIKAAPKRKARRR